MEYAIVKVPAAPVRRKPRHQSEMTNQLLFGDSIQLLKEKGSLWVKVRSLSDNYEGWMTRTLLQFVEEEEARTFSSYVAADLLNATIINGTRMMIPIGSSLPRFLDGEGIQKKLIYSFDGRFIKRDEQSLNPELLEKLTTQWLNAPYLWGGKTILGVDCSGFVQVNYKMMGIDLPRDAWQQAQEGETIKKLKDATPGDLAFFDDNDEIVHVGILLDNERIIHASGKVRIDTLTKKGIINSDTGKQTHALRVIKRCY